MSAQVDVLAVIDDAAHALNHTRTASERLALLDARADVAALIAERDALQERLNTNRCNRGHETLPLTLWDCPECHNETRRERDALREALSEMTELAAGPAGGVSQAQKVAILKKARAALTTGESA